MKDADRRRVTSATYMRYRSVPSLVFTRVHMAGVVSVSVSSVAGVVSVNVSSVAGLVSVNVSSVLAARCPELPDWRPLGVSTRH